MAEIDVNMAAHSLYDKSPNRTRKYKKREDLGPMEVDDLQSRKEDAAVYQGLSTEELIFHIFGDSGSDAPGATAAISVKPLGLQNLEFFIDNELDEAARSVSSEPEDAGRIGPKKVMFDVTSNVGSFVIDRDKLGVSSQSNFSSIRANVCVYKGKWQYELMLGSKGVMQLGWATLHCQFSQERGVGDTPNSYAYDGNRVRKWNMATYKYGESWLTGDIIGVTIDLDNGTIHFYRNGRSLGEAFNGLRMGPGIAYFPAVSLAFNENLVANFGATPLKYPVPGYQPLQDPPNIDLVKARRLISWLGRLLPLLLEAKEQTKASLSKSSVSLSLSPIRSCQGTLMLIAGHIVHRLGPLLMSVYVTEGYLLTFLVNLYDQISDNEEQTSLAPQPHIQKLLDVLWAFLEDFEIKQCLENLIIGLLTAYRFSPISPDFLYQRKYLALTLAVLQHEKTRILLLRYVLFDKIKFPIFLHVKPLDNDGLAESVPEVWWEMPKENLPRDPDLPNENQKIAYEKSIQKLKRSVAVVFPRVSVEIYSYFFVLLSKALEAIQVELLKVLLEDKDSPNVENSTRQVFLGKFREFLRENMTGSRVHPVHLCPLPVTLCFFHRLIQALRFYWDQYVSNSASSDCAILTSSSKAYVPSRVFYDDSINFFEIQRIGGLLSHLKKALREEVSQALGTKEGVSFQGKEMTDASLSVPTASATQGSVDPVTSAIDKSPPSPPPDNSQQPLSSLVEILDGVILLYHIAAHKQLAKMCSLRESMQEYITALQDTQVKIQRCYEEDYDSEVLSALQQAKAVFLEKLSEQARHTAWVQAVIYSPEKQADVYWLLHILLRTLNRASLEGQLFAFVPDYYIEVCINSCSALRSYFGPSTPSTDLPGYHETLVEVSLFLTTHFADKRVVNADIKDTLIQAVASFVCHPTTLKAMENMPRESRISMVRALLQPYENRAWAQSNWILVRLWKGCGFGFRYTQPPHMAKRLGPKQQSENSLSNQFHKPCPSELFQVHVAELLQEDPELATSFLNSVLNQLNWAFSEFIGMLQEIQNASNRPERVFIDSRQLKICATCFDLALALLRVLEMIVHVSPGLFTDWTKQSAELLLARLCQLLCQVLNRVTSRSGCFDHVVAMEIPGLETIDHFPIVAAVTGILVQLLLRGSPQSQECATVALLAEPSFQIASIEFLLGLPQGAIAKPFTIKKNFSLTNYDEIDSIELRNVEHLLRYLQIEQKKMQDVAKIAPEEELCTICYAHQISAEFRPCGHQSCRACISHHLMNRSECFFCKASIELVLDPSGKVLHDLTKKAAAASKQQQT